MMFVTELRCLNCYRRRVLRGKEPMVHEGNVLKRDDVIVYDVCVDCGCCVWGIDNAYEEKVGLYDSNYGKVYKVAKGGLK